MFLKLFYDQIKGKSNYYFLIMTVGSHHRPTIW